MIIKKELKIKTEEIVMSSCIVSPMRSTSGFNKSKCEKCDYFKEPNMCIYGTTIREVINESQISDAYYYRKMQCANCNETIKISSTHSLLRSGEHYKCDKCGTLHTYIENQKGNHIFAIPLTENVPL